MLSKVINKGLRIMHLVPIYRKSKNYIQYLNSEIGQFGINRSSRDEKIVVSLTSVPARFENLHLVIQCMLAQTMKADRIIVYLDEGISIDDLPESLISLQQYGVEILTRSEDIRPHKKYYYAIRENPSSLVITIDDDILYPLYLIEELYKTHKMFPECVVAARAHRILFNKDGSVKKYSEWESEYCFSYKPSMSLLATGVGGVLYPPHCLYSEADDIKLIHDLSLTADDIWLKIMQVLKGTKTVLCSQKVRINEILIPGSQEVNLHTSNVNEKMNDYFLNNLLEYYHLSKNDFLEENGSM